MVAVTKVARLIEDEAEAINETKLVVPVRVGPKENTTLPPTPVSSVRIPPKLADESVPKYVVESPVILPAEVTRLTFPVPNCAAPKKSKLPLPSIVILSLVPSAEDEEILNLAPSE